MPPSNCRVYVRKFVKGCSEFETNRLYLGHMSPCGMDFYFYDGRNNLVHLLDEDDFEVYPGV